MTNQIKPYESKITEYKKEKINETHQKIFNKVNKKNIKSDIDVSDEIEKIKENDQNLLTQVITDDIKGDFCDEKASDLDPILKKVKKSNNRYSKAFKCDKCDKKYTWYSGLSNHKRFAHSRPKET